jgi:hypothetical protein
VYTLGRLLLLAAVLAGFTAGDVAAAQSSIDTIEASPRVGSEPPPAPVAASVEGTTLRDGRGAAPVGDGLEDGSELRLAARTLAGRERVPPVASTRVRAPRAAMRAPEPPPPNARHASLFRIP